PEPDLHPLDGLDAHHGLSQEPVELAVPLDMTSQTERRIEDLDLDDAPQRISLRRRPIDALDDLSVGLGIECVHGTRVAQGLELFASAVARRRGDLLEL